MKSTSFFCNYHISLNWFQCLFPENTYFIRRNDCVSFPIDANVNRYINSPNIWLLGIQMLIKFPGQAFTEISFNNASSTYCGNISWGHVASINALSHIISLFLALKKQGRQDERYPAAINNIYNWLTLQGHLCDMVFWLGNFAKQVRALVSYRICNKVANLQ